MSDSDEVSEQALELEEIPVLPLRDVVVFPNVVIPLFVGREQSIKALDLAMQNGKQIMLVAQRSPDIDEPGTQDIYHVGTLSNVLQLLKLPDGTLKVLVEGAERARIDLLSDSRGFFTADVTRLVSGGGDEKEMEVVTRSLLAIFEQYVKLNRKIPAELLTTLAGIDYPDRLADTVAAHLNVKLEEKQRLLEIVDIQERLECLIGMVESEIDVLQIEKRIRGRVKQQMEKSQREYYLNEQMKAIQKELGDDEGGGDVDDLTERLGKAGMPKEAHEKARGELNKLRMMPPMSAEATVVRNYLDIMLSIPWKKRSKVRRDLDAAQTFLEADHYGLEKVNERILEYLAVQMRVKKMKGSILCLVGPPGVGKTSLGQSMAKATGRRFVRMSLGGVRDEAEIRGHRRTYIGSMPGRIVQRLIKGKARNPLFMLDELDKMSMDFRGDPSAALLEVLDPEQNHAFNDHYLEVDLDLSEVMFIATANSLNIPPALLDRMEVIRIPGYTELEKIQIAQRHLVAKQLKAHGLKADEIKISKTAIVDIIRYYTREAGVRNLERDIAKVCRKVVKELALHKAKKRVGISNRNLGKYLGVKRFTYGRAGEHDEVGQVTGLAWTEAGGELLTIEASVMPGKGKLQHTGQLGDVMQESIQAAMTIVRSRSESLGIQADFHLNHDVHIHVPEGATPKDGPSAGVAMCTAVVSALNAIPVRADVAMTGEITLRGKVLPIGGLKEKLLAASRGGIKTVIIPGENEKDLAEIPSGITANLEILPVSWIDEVLSVALTKPPVPRTESSVDTAKKAAAETKPTPAVRRH